jgi:hypothetical protein
VPLALPEVNMFANTYRRSKARPRVRNQACSRSIGGFRLTTGQSVEARAPVKKLCGPLTIRMIL